MFNNFKKQFNIKVKNGTVISENSGTVVISQKDTDDNNKPLNIIGIVVGIIGIVVTIIGIINGYIAFVK